MSKATVNAFNEVITLVLSVARIANNINIVADILRTYANAYLDLYNTMSDLARDERVTNGETSYYVAMRKCADGYSLKEMWLSSFITSLDRYNNVSYPIDINALARQIAINNGNVKPHCKYKLTPTISKVQRDTYDMIKDVTRYALRVMKASDSIEHMMHRFERMEHIYWDVSCEHYDDWYTHDDYRAFEDYEYHRAKANMLDSIAREVRVSRAYPETFHFEYPFNSEVFNTPVSLLA